MHDRTTYQGDFGNSYLTPPFRSASFYATLILTILVPVGLWFVQTSIKEVLQDFDLEVSQLTIVFLNPFLPFILLALPLGVVVKELLFQDQRVRFQCDSFLSALAIIALVVAYLALVKPLSELLNGLQG